MKENFNAISDALSDAGLSTSLEDTAGKPLDFKFTPYSLNTKLSFRFENLGEFTDFIKGSGAALPEDKAMAINTALMELGLDADQFFYVNFFEKGKESDM